MLPHEGKTFPVATLKIGDNQLTDFFHLTQYLQNTTSVCNVYKTLVLFIFFQLEF